MSENPKKYIELETKYSATLDQLNDFKFLVRKSNLMTKFFYCEGPDSYYTKKGTSSFKRFRKTVHPDQFYKEITTKVKPEGAKSNISRVEKNLRVDGNTDELIVSMILDDGYEFDFTIWKNCHIYSNDHVTLVFYSVTDITDPDKTTEECFIEIEVDEDYIDNISEEEAKKIIRNYENLLAPLGINPQKRLYKSLYERYTRI